MAFERLIETDTWNSENRMLGANLNMSVYNIEKTSIFSVLSQTR